jgi:predicted PurR-regulated permease PerM
MEVQGDDKNLTNVAPPTGDNNEQSKTDNIKRVAYVVLGVIVLLFLLFLLFTQVGPPVVDFFKELFAFSNPNDYNLSDAFGISE